MQQSFKISHRCITEGTQFAIGRHISEWSKIGKNIAIIISVIIIITV